MKCLTLEMIFRCADDQEFGYIRIEEFKKFNDDDPLRFLLVFRAKSGRLSQRQRCTVPDSMDSIGQVATC